MKGGHGHSHSPAPAKPDDKVFHTILRIISVIEMFFFFKYFKFFSPRIAHKALQNISLLLKIYFHLKN